MAEEKDSANHGIVFWWQGIRIKEASGAGQCVTEASLNDGCEVMHYSIEKLAKGGEGVTRMGGKTFFIEGALPGEQGEFDVTEEKPRYGRGVVRTVALASAIRVMDACEVASCQGCGFRHVDSDAALALKAAATHEAVMRLSGLSGLSMRLWPVSEHDGSRRRMRLHATPQGVGSFAKGTHRIVDASRCLVIAPELRTVSADLVQTLPRLGEAFDIQVDLDESGNAYAHFKPSPPERDSGRRGGRQGRTSGGPACVREGAKFTQAARQVIDAYVQSALTRGILKGARIDEAFRGDRYMRDAVSSYGKEVVTYRRIGDFGQTTREANAHIHGILDEALQRCQPQTVIDLYCGSGNYTFRAACHAPHVIGCEFYCDPSAFALGRDANARHFCAGARVDLQLTNLALGLPGNLPPSDFVVCDPSREGLSTGVCRDLMAMAPRHILYISCEAACLGRDLAILGERYAVDGIDYVDMFPRTPHVEAVCLLERR